MHITSLWNSTVTLMRSFLLINKLKTDLQANYKKSILKAENAFFIAAEARTPPPIEVGVDVTCYGRAF